MIPCSGSEFSYRDALRWRDWGIDKVPTFFLACFYCLLLGGDYSSAVFVDFGLCISLLISASIFGYTLNDLADQNLDLAQGKPNCCRGITLPERILLIGGPAIAVFTITYLLRDRFMMVPLVGAWFFMAAFYSLEPLRFKERGRIGLVVSVLCQFPLPLLMLFAVFGHSNALDVSVFVLYGAAKGAALDIGHQRHDYYRDFSTNTRTYAVRAGFQRASLAYRRALALERTMLGILIALMCIRFWSAPGDHPPFAALCLGVVALVYAALLFANHGLVSLGDDVDEASDPYYGDTHSSLKVLHVVVPANLMPAMLLVMMSIDSHWNLILLGLFLLWVRPTLDKMTWVAESISKRPFLAKKEPGHPVQDYVSDRPAGETRMRVNR